MNIKHIAPLSGFLLAMGVFAGAAVADGNVTCTSEPQDKWKPQKEAEEAAKKEGYEVTKVIVTKGGCYEVYAKKDKKLFELFYDPTNN